MDGSQVTGSFSFDASSKTYGLMSLIPRTHLVQNGLASCKLSTSKVQVSQADHHILFEQTPFNKACYLMKVASHQNTPVYILVQEKVGQPPQTNGNQLTTAQKMSLEKYLRDISTGLGKTKMSRAQKQEYMDRLTDHLDYRFEIKNTSVSPRISRSYYAASTRKVEMPLLIKHLQAI